MTGIETDFANPQETDRKIIVQPYASFINKTSNIWDSNSDAANSATENEISIAAMGRNKRNRKSCQLLMGDEFVDTSVPNWRQRKTNSVAKQISTHNSNENTKITELAPIKYGVGCLVWARITGHPWWPCMICYDVDGSLQYTKLSGSRRPRRHSFVEFFGPTVEHAWIADTALIEYQGMDEFKNYAQKQVDEATTKVIKEKLAERFQLKVALSKRAYWEEAVKEADKVVKFSIKDRLKWRSSKLLEIQKPKTIAQGVLIKKIPTVSSNSTITKRRTSSIPSSSAPSDEKLPSKKSVIKEENIDKEDNVKLSNANHHVSLRSATLKNIPRKQLPNEQSSQTKTSVVSFSRKKSIEHINRLDSCLYCKFSFANGQTAKQIATHFLTCFKNSSAKKLLKCPFCSRSFRKLKWSYHKIRCHVHACSKRVYGMTSNVRNESTTTDQRRKLRVLSRPNASQLDTAHNVTNTLSTSTTRRFLVKHPPQLHGRRSLQIQPTKAPEINQSAFSPLKSTQSPVIPTPIIQPPKLIVSSFSKSSTQLAKSHTPLRTKHTPILPKHTPILSKHTPILPKHTPILSKHTPILPKPACLSLKSNDLLKTSEFSKLSTKLTKSHLKTSNLTSNQLTNGSVKTPTASTNHLQKSLSNVRKSLVNRPTRLSLNVPSRPFISHPSNQADNEACKRTKDLVLPAQEDCNITMSTTVEKPKVKLITTKQNNISEPQVLLRSPILEENISARSFDELNSRNKAETVDKNVLFQTSLNSRSSLTSTELQDRLNDRYQALEALSKGTCIADVSLRFQLPRSVIESDFHGDFSTIVDKGVILGRLDLAACDIEEGNRASIAALKYRLPYKYLLMVIRGKSQQFTVEQFYTDFERWKEENLKRRLSNTEKNIQENIQQSFKRRKLTQVPQTSQSFCSSMIGISENDSIKHMNQHKSSDSSLNHPISRGSSFQRYSFEPLSDNRPQISKRCETHCNSHPVFLISDDEIPNSPKNDQTPLPIDRFSFGLTADEEMQIVKDATNLQDKFTADQFAISTAQHIIKNRFPSTSKKIIGKDWWHFVLFKYPSLRQAILDFYKDKHQSISQLPLNFAYKSITCDLPIESPAVIIPSRLKAREPKNNIISIQQRKQSVLKSVHPIADDPLRFSKISARRSSTMADNAQCNLQLPAVLDNDSSVRKSQRIAKRKNE